MHPKADEWVWLDVSSAGHIPSCRSSGTQPEPTMTLQSLCCVSSGGHGNRFWQEVDILRPSGALTTRALAANFLWTWFKPMEPRRHSTGCPTISWSEDRCHCLQPEDRDNQLMAGPTKTQTCTRLMELNASCLHSPQMSFCRRLVSKNVFFSLWLHLSKVTFRWIPCLSGLC